METYELRKISKKALGKYVHST